MAVKFKSKKTTNLKNLNDVFFVTVRETCRLTSLSRSTITKLEKKGEFPKRVQLTENRVGFRKCEVEEWANKI